MSTFLCRSVLLLLLLAVFGCGRQAAPARFSTVSQGGFNPERSFRARGYDLTKASNRGVSNPSVSSCWHSWQGVVTIPGTSNACDEVAMAIRDALTSSAGDGCRDELVAVPITNPAGRSGELSYQKDGMQGMVHVWLFGTPSEDRVSYTILLREERAGRKPERSSAPPRWQFWRANWSGKP